MQGDGVGEGAAWVGGEGGDSEVQTELGQIDYLAIGHISVDIFDKRYVLGGTASFAALTARKLGQRVGVLTSATTTPTAFVRDLSARFAGEVPDLAVARPTLEDVYLRMIGEPA